MNRTHFKLLIILLISPCLTPNGRAAEDDPTAWPEVTSTARPWAYWWWMGSAVDRDNLARELTRYRDAGLGGVHIIPIYGAKGFEARYIDYLSPRWLEMLGFTVAEAKRLGLGVDITLGTGWCFGGPTITPREANARVVVKTYDVPAGGRLKESIDPGVTQALVACSDGKNSLDLTGRIGPDGAVDWVADGGPWTVYAVGQRPSGQKVKRAAPGGEGDMLNPFSREAIRHYLDGFDHALAAYNGPMPRAVYQDSYEYQSDWSPDLFAEFQRRRGYRLQDHLPELFGKEPREFSARVKHDYRATISDMMVENVTPAWVEWAHSRHLLTRNEAHGSPGNLLDLYAAADIPETEMFSKDRDPLVAKFASSAAHVAGRRLTSSESGTWIAEHFHETLGDLKRLMDEFFVSGVNHVFYHGTCYSPDDAPWPGWVFYAATEMNPRNAIWHDVPALNAYIARAQSVLQSGRPDNDILLYWPIADQWQDSRGLVQPMTVHSEGWLTDHPIGHAARRLRERGYTFDYVSDRQLSRAKPFFNGIEMPGEFYQAVVVPTCDLMPPETLETLIKLAGDGATVIFQDRLPVDVPGLGDLDRRRAAFRRLLDGLKLKETGGGLKQSQYVGGRLYVGDVEAALARAGIARETMVDLDGVQFIRRGRESGPVRVSVINGGARSMNRGMTSGRHYFIAHQGDRPIDGWVTLATPAESVLALDPMTSRVGKCATGRGGAGKTAVYLQLDPGGSIILRTSPAPAPDAPDWPYEKPTGPPIEVGGPWRVAFLQGGPATPAPFESPKPGSWTTLGDDEARRFSGTARYTTTFDPPWAGRFRIDLGAVAESAHVFLNGRDLGTRLLAPFRFPADGLKPSGNVLEVEVTNLSANRLRDLDRRKVEWKTFRDINFVSITYKPFDASGWPIRDSGLLVPVTLIPVGAFRPGGPASNGGGHE